MNFIQRIFKRKIFRGNGQRNREPQPKQLRIDGCKTELTPIPDDAELAAQALLESRIYGDKTQRRKKQPLPQPLPKKEGERDAEYYRQLSDKIKESHEHDARMATRYVAYVEGKIEEWKNSKIEIPNGGGEELQSFNSSILPSLERGLFKWQDTVEREGGELLKRWQKCLAETIVRETINNSQ